MGSISITEQAGNVALACAPRRKNMKQDWLADLAKDQYLEVVQGAKRHSMRRGLSGVVCGVVKAFTQVESHRNNHPKRRKLPNGWIVVVVVQARED